MHSVAFDIGGVAIYWYGVLTALGFLAGFWTAARRAPRTGITAEAVMDLAPWLLLGTIAGARGWYVAYHWTQEFAGKPFWEVFMIRRSGLVFYGGLIGASAATVLYVRIKSLPLWRVADILAPSIPLGHAFGRVGCLMTGCCFGRPTDLPWAIHFPPDHWTGGAGVHPTQIYEAILNAALFSGLAWLYRRKRFDGHVFGVYLVAYGVARGLVEIFRGDYSTYLLGGRITPAQIFSVGIIVAGSILLWWLSGAAQGSSGTGPHRGRTSRNA